MFTVYGYMLYYYFIPRYPVHALLEYLLSQTTTTTSVENCIHFCNKRFSLVTISSTCKFIMLKYRLSPINF